MSLGPVMVDVAGVELDAVEREMLRHPMVGGVILFSRNFESIQQLEALVDSIHAVRNPRLIVAVDQEGGRVQRFREGFTRLPAVRRLGELYDENSKRGRYCAEVSGWLMASELLAIGIDLSFAPVLDLDYGVSSVIGDRAFHRQAEVVAELAHAYTLGMRKAGMSATGKHFPGHGAVKADSHTDLPIDEREYVDFAQLDILPFERMIHYDIEAMMMAHVVYPRVDSLPASFSRIWIKDILRDQLGFQGVIFSDDLSMAAAESVGSYSDRAMLSLEAGCDMVLVCNKPQGRDEVLDHVYQQDNPTSHLRLVRMHGRAQMNRHELHQSDQWLKAVELVLRYDQDPLLDLDFDV